MKRYNIWEKFKAVLLIISIVAFIIFSPVLTNFILSMKKPTDIIIIDNSEWIGFYGSIIGGIITFLSLFITLRFQKKREENNNRMQVYPFMRYTIFNNYEVPNDMIGEIPHYFLDDHEEIGKKEQKIDATARLIIKNIGLNSAIEFNILEVKFLGCGDITRHEFDAIEVGEEKEILFDILMPSRCLNSEHYIPLKIEVLVGYSDLLGYYYEQKVILAILDNSILTNRSGKCVKEWRFKIVIDSVEKSLVFENKDIKKEKFKRLDDFLNHNTIKYKIKKIINRKKSSNSSKK